MGRKKKYNKYEMKCYVQLWLLLEATRQEIRRNYKRFTLRRIMHTWFGEDVPDEQIREVCFRANSYGAEIYGYDLLPRPAQYPKKHRMMLRAIISVRSGIPMRAVDSYAIDRAHDLAFPGIHPTINEDGTQVYPNKPPRRRQKDDPDFMLAALFPDETLKKLEDKQDEIFYEVENEIAQLISKEKKHRR